VARPSETLIKLHAISKEYRMGPTSVHAVQHASLTLRAGEFVLLQGPSGSGKTTLLSIMGLLMKPSDGRIWLCGQDVTTMGEDQLPKLRLRHIGFVFQTYNLFPALTAVQNVTLALKLKGYGWRERRVEARRLLERVGLSDCMYRRPDELSGGQRQRVSIARALSGSADIILADEPTAALDTHTGLSIMKLLKEETEAGRKAVFCVTHDVRLEPFATRVDHIIDGVLTADARTPMGMQAVNGNGNGVPAHGNGAPAPAPVNTIPTPDAGPPPQPADVAPQ
jgi:putative ABC transport system ATP-binding protein